MFAGDPINVIRTDDGFDAFYTDDIKGVKKISGNDFEVFPENTDDTFAIMNACYCNEVCKASGVNGKQYEKDCDFYWQLKIKQQEKKLNETKKVMVYYSVYSESVDEGEDCML